ncbi:hypothetical protein BpHYR1_037646 [Brachionus plicatilis]|uniref:Uncharacterized protein n=1 Tax=Brachionus plicatilis TaxID=10195 RepID=A0A3M7RK28_BRAPC|nr:hypothetical protein BpHYR1_037646 [Brachionus plicatilis]
MSKILPLIFNCRSQLDKKFTLISSILIKNKNQKEKSLGKNYGRLNYKSRNKLKNNFLFFIHYGSQQSERLITLNNLQKLFQKNGDISRKHLINFTLNFSFIMGIGKIKTEDYFCELPQKNEAKKFIISRSSQK